MFYLYVNYIIYKLVLSYFNLLVFNVFLFVCTVVCYNISLSVWAHHYHLYYSSQQFEKQTLLKHIGNESKTLLSK